MSTLLFSSCDSHIHYTLPHLVSTLRNPRTKKRAFICARAEKAVSMKGQYGDK